MKHTDMPMPNRRSVSACASAGLTAAITLTNASWA
jgi:hypothetical protein